MAVTEGVIRVRQQDRTLTLRVEGRATLVQSLPLRRFVEKCLCDDVAALRLDLRDCTYMDSTFLGTLLVLKSAVGRRGEGDVVLVSPSPTCRRLLEQMSLDVVFPVVQGDGPAADDWQELPRAPEDLDEFKQTVAQAHRNLARLPGRAGESFQAVVRCLDRELEAGEAPKKS